jgi:hypothetical protein
MSYKYPQYYMTALLDRIGATEPVAQDRWTWNIMDRTRLGGTVANVAGNTTATATFEIDEFDFDGVATFGYLVVGDVIRLESGELGRVTAVDVSTTLTDKQEVTVVRVKGGDWTAALLADAMVFGHAFSLFGEASSAPEGRLYLPVEETGYLSILRRTIEISGDEFTNRTRIGDGKAWYFTVEDIELKEFSRDRENLILFGQESTSGVKATKGILDFALNEGINNGFIGAVGVSELDIQNHIQSLLVEGVSNELTVLCGSQFLADFQRAMKDYVLLGGVSYGSFGANTVGLDIHQYFFLGKKINVVYYELFDDVKVVPYSGTPSASKIDFSNFSLWIDLGTDSGGRSLITLKYKALDGMSRKFIHATEAGMMNPNGSGGMVASGDDSFKVYYLSHIGIEVRLPNRLGVLRASS